MDKITYSYIEIKAFENSKVIKRFDVTNTNDKRKDLIEGGMNRNLNHEKYYTFSFDSETKLEKIN